MNLTEKILAAKLLPGQGEYVKPGDAVLVKVDAGYSHEFTTAQVDKFLADEYGADYKLAEPDEVRRVRGPPDLRDRRRVDGEVRAEDREAARAAEGVRREDRRAQLQRRRRRLAGHLPPGRARAVHRSGRLRAGDRLAHVHGRRVGRARVGRRRDRVRGAALLGLHAARGARVDPLRAHRQAAGRASPRRT